MSHEKENQVDHLVIVSHPMIHLDDDAYIDDDLVIDILYVVMGNYFNDFQGLI